MHTLSIGSSLRFGWETFKKRPWFLIGVTALTIVISWAIGSVAGTFGDKGTGALLGAIVNIALSTLLGLGMTTFLLKVHDSVENAKVDDLWNPRPFVSFLVAQILMMFIIVIGLFLLIVPGIILSLMLIFTPYLIVTRHMGPVAALQESRRMTRGHKWQLLGLILLVAVINILGILCILVGLLITVPVTSLAIVHAFRSIERGAAHEAA